MIVVEISPHRDMDSDPVGRTPKTPFDVHFEGLLPGVAGQRFYSQMIDGWVWNIWRGQVVARRDVRRAGDRRNARRRIRRGDAPLGREAPVRLDRRIARLPRPERLLRRAVAGRLWSHFELRTPTSEQWSRRAARRPRRSIPRRGVELSMSRPVPPSSCGTTTIRPGEHQLELGRFRCSRGMGDCLPRACGGTYIVRLEYPRYRWLSLTAITAFFFGFHAAINRVAQPFRAASVS